MKQHLGTKQLPNLKNYFSSQTMPHPALGTVQTVLLLQTDSRSVGPLRLAPAAGLRAPGGGVPAAPVLERSSPVWMCPRWLTLLPDDGCWGCFQFWSVI